MSAAHEVVHVAWGGSRADGVRDALRLQGCEERVIPLTHTLSLGPIYPFDTAARQAWGKANMRMHDEPRQERTDLEAPWTEATASGVHPVYWVCLTDPSEHACFLEFASRMAGRPFDIVDATSVDFSGVCRISPIWSLGQLRPEEIVASRLGERRRPFTAPEREAAMAAWSRLRRENAPVRVLRDGCLVSVPLTHFDGILTGQASSEWEILVNLVARTLCHLDTELDPPCHGCSDELLFARILALAAAGSLEVTGPGPGMRDYEVRRPAAPQGQPSVAPAP